MTNLAGFVLGALVALASPAPAGPLTPTPPQRTVPAARNVPAGPRDLLFDQLALRWLDRHGYAEPLGGLTPEQILKERFTRLDLGALDLRLPPEALADGAWNKRLGKALVALVDAQVEFLAWLAGPDAAKELARETRGYRKELARWLKGLKAKQFAEPDAFRGKSLVEVLQPKESVLEALRAFQDYCTKGGPLDREVRLIPARLVFQPERRDLVELACTVGLLRPDLRGFFWVTGIETWTMFDLDGARVVGLEYAGPRAKDDLTDAIAMDGRNKDALAEHVVQLGVRALMESVSRGKIEPMLAAGLANDLVIEMYGEVDTRSDGDLRSRSTSGRSVFVPGGNPNGGFLPPTNAESRWRVDKGREHFWAVLKGVQKNGGKRGRTKGEKLGRFRLQNDDQSATHTMAAPFFGPGALSPPAPEFLGDYAELLRAYRAGFLAWLREQGGGSASESGRKFARLLRAATDPAERRGLGELFEEVYGVPLSAEGTEELFEGDSLEGRFLLWLPKS